MAEIFSKQNINGVFIPSGLLVFGTLIVKSEWVPYAFILAALLSGYKLFNGRMSWPPPSWPLSS